MNRRPLPADRTASPAPPGLPILITVLTLLTLLCPFGCKLELPPLADAAVDAAPSFDQPIGAACDVMESLLCASGVGLCHASICTMFCSAIEFPRCPDGATEVHDTAGEHQLCVCEPS